MSTPPLPQLSQLALPDLIAGCQHEAQQNRSEEMGYCFELFQRAFNHHDEHAWVAIQEQYQQLVLSWIYNRVPNSTGTQARELAQETLAKFWRTINRREGRLETHFAHVGALLNYLRQCTFTTVIDSQRRQQRRARLKEKIRLAESINLVQENPERAVLAQILQEEKLALIRAWVSHNVTDPQERLVLHLSFEYNMPPTEIAHHHPEQFENAQAVRRVKERVLKRARRALA